MVSCTGRQDAEESCLLGIDCHDRATVGLVLRVLADTAITLDGDGYVGSFQISLQLQPVLVPSCIPPYGLARIFIAASAEQPCAVASRKKGEVSGSKVTTFCFGSKTPRGDNTPSKNGEFSYYRENLRNRKTYGKRV